MNCFSKLILGYILSTEDKELNGSDNATISYLDKSLFIPEYADWSGYFLETRREYKIISW